MFVQVYLYDLGQGLAKLGGNPAFGQSLEGVRIEFEKTQTSVHHLFVEYYGYYVNSKTFLFNSTVTGQTALQLCDTLCKIDI